MPTSPKPPPAHTGMDVLNCGSLPPSIADIMPPNELPVMPMTVSLPPMSTLPSPSKSPAMSSSVLPLPLASKGHFCTPSNARSVRMSCM